MDLEERLLNTHKHAVERNEFDRLASKIRSRPGSPAEFEPLIRGKIFRKKGEKLDYAMAPNNLYIIKGGCSRSQLKGIEASIWNACFRRYFLSSEDRDFYADYFIFMKGYFHDPRYTLAGFSGKLCTDYGEVCLKFFENKISYEAAVPAGSKDPMGELLDDYAFCNPVKSMDCSWLFGFVDLLKENFKSSNFFLRWLDIQVSLKGEFVSDAAKHLGKRIIPYTPLSQQNTYICLSNAGKVRRKIMTEYGQNAKRSIQYMVHVSCLGEGDLESVLEKDSIMF